MAAHLAVLEPARQADSIVVIEAGDYRSSKARDARDAARTEGKVPLLPYQLDIVQAIAASIRAHPIAAPAFKGGEAEVTLAWHDPETGIPCKARPDYLPAHGQWLVDLKTAASANPRSWRDQAYRLGYHARAAWYLDGAAAVLRQAPEEYWFVIVEKEAPYLVSVVSFDEDALRWGLVNRLCAPETLIQEALETANAIAANAPLSVRQAKKSIHLGLQMDLRSALRFEIEAYNRLIPTKDRDEGIRAFNEKRKPQFRGR